MTVDQAQPLLKPIEGDIAWVGSTLDSEDGRLAFGPDCLSELHQLVELLRANPLPLLALDPTNYELPFCRALMQEAHSVLKHGVGFVLIDRLPLDEWSTEEATAVYWLLCSMIERPVAQKWDGTMIYSVRDSGKPVGNGVRADVTNVEQNFHTDNSYNLCPPWYVGLMCLQTAKEGGVSSITSLSTAHNEMLRRFPDLLPRLYDNFVFDRQREHAPTDTQTLRHPIYEFDESGLITRLSISLIRGGYQLAGENIDSRGQEAIEAFETILKEPRWCKDFYFEPGQIQLVNNRRCGHRRTAFVDWPEPEKRRHLIRLWLRRGGLTSYHG